MTCSSPPSAKHRAVLSARLVMPAMIAESCSAPARSSELDIAINKPSDDTATASVTPGVASTKLDSNQLKLRTSALPATAFAPSDCTVNALSRHRYRLPHEPVRLRLGRRRRTQTVRPCRPA